MKTSHVALLLFAVTAGAQTAAPPKPATVAGIVLNSVTNEPLRKVDLSLSGGDEMGDSMEAAMAMFGGDADKPPAAAKPPGKAFHAISDAAGKFHFDGVDPGDYYLKATHAGYADSTYKPKENGVGGKLHVAAGDALTAIALSLVPYGSVSGRVVDEDGDPIAGATASALIAHYAAGQPKLTPADSSPANSKGEFHLEKLPAGRYFISASVTKMDFAGILGSTPPPPADGSPETGYVTTYFPGTTNVSDATKVDVVAGSDLPGLVIKLRKSRVVRVSGQALTADGTPMTAGSVMLMNVASLGSMQMGMVRPDGHFELANVQPGSYMLMTVEMKGTSPSIQMHTIVVPNEGLKDVKLASLPQGTVQGKIVVSGEGTVQTKGLMVMLASGEGDMAMPAFGRVTDDGTFSLKASPAAYRLTLQPLPAGAYLKSLQWNGREYVGKTLDFSAGVSGDLLITLATDGGTVDIAVSGPGGKPAVESTVVLLPSQPDQRVEALTKQADTDDTGHVKFTGVPPGSYIALSWKQVDDGAWFDPDFLKRFEKNAESVTVDSKATRKVELKEIPESQ